MGVRSILQVDVDTSQFKKYQLLYEKYQQSLTKQPALWKQSGIQVTHIASAFEKQTAAMLAQSHLARMNNESGKMQGRQLEQSNRLWGSIAKKTSGVAGDILSATKSLLSWTTILTGIGGLLGAGGLFGIDKMAATAGNSRRSATGLGLSIGEQRAFQVNFSRLVDPDAFLGWVNQMETDPTKQWSASALGVGLTGSTEKDAVSTLRALRSRAQATPTSLLGLLPQQFGLSGVGTEDLRRLKSMSGSEFDQLLSGNGRDVGGLNIADETAKKWQDLTNQLERAKSQIFKTFVEGLEPLEKPLEHLSDAAEKFLSTLLKSDLVKEGITNLAHWLDSFSGELGGSEFLDKVRQFTSDVGALADAIHAIAHPGQTTDKAVFGGSIGAISSRNAFLDSPTKQAYLQRLGSAEKGFKLPAGMLAYQWQKESGSTFNPADSRAGAMGPFQLQAGTAKWLSDTYGIPIDPHDPLKSALGAAEYDQYLMQRYKGDVAKALAAYNLGPHKLDSVVASHPKDWQRYVPAETRGYIAGASSLGGGVRIEINNNTGGAAVPIASQLAH